MTLIVLSAINNVFMCILVVVMIRDSALINSEFISVIADLTNVSIETIAMWLDRGKKIFAGFFIATCAWDSLATFYKCGLKSDKVIDHKNLKI